MDSGFEAPRFVARTLARLKIEATFGDTLCGTSTAAVPGSIEASTCRSRLAYASRSRKARSTCWARHGTRYNPLKTWEGLTVRCLLAPAKLKADSTIR